ncbi:MAG: hypothetical protein HYX56_03710 [Chloroflexi bacterium]|nr:hypothetical protein [Chloroflexota bacterium]
MDDPERLRELVASALYGTFRAHMISGAVVPGALHEEAVRAVIGAMSSVIGPDAARELGAALERDLDRATS